ncbi:MAG: hypothetical protein ABIH53_03635 [archaeon]
MPKANKKISMPTHLCHHAIGLGLLGVGWLVTGLFVGSTGLWVLGQIVIGVAIAKKFLHKKCSCSTCCK